MRSVDGRDAIGDHLERRPTASGRVAHALLRVQRVYALRTQRARTLGIMTNSVRAPAGDDRDLNGVATIEGRPAPRATPVAAGDLRVLDSGSRYDVRRLGEDHFFGGSHPRDSPTTCMHCKSSRRPGAQV